MGLFGLGKMTLASVFKKPETIQYPFETKPQPAGLKGQIEIDKDVCILCGACMKSCTTGAITVERKERTWSIDRFRCVQCGLCLRRCPKECLSMNPASPPVSVSKSIENVEIPEHETPKKQVASQPTASTENTESAAGTSTDTAGLSAEQIAEIEAKTAALPPEKAAKVRAALIAKARG